MSFDRWMNHLKIQMQKASDDGLQKKMQYQLLHDGWKTDESTFKPAYAKVLENYLRKKIPG